MSIINGQAVDAPNSNAAWISKNTNDTAVGIYTFANVNPVSGPNISNGQREWNSQASFLGMAINQVYNYLPTWTNNDVGLSTDTVKLRVDNITQKFNSASGHSHDGSVGGGAPIVSSDITGVPLKGYVIQGTDITGVTGGSTDVSSLMTGKTDSSGPTDPGVVVTVPFNKVLLREASGTNTDEQIMDGDNIVYGRITFAASVWTLTYYTDVAGTETPYTFTVSTDIRWYYQELFNPMVNPPVYSEFAFVPSDGASSGSGTGFVRATLYDPVSTTLPAGTGATIDGVAVANDDLVLFSNLSVNNNRVYKVSGVGVALVWTVQSVFPAGVDASLSDAVMIQEGIAFALQVGIFNATTFKFNDTVRYFSGTDYWETTSIKTAALANNTTGTVFSLNITGSENIIIKYSIIRNTAKETGELYLTSDGTSVALSSGFTYLVGSGVTFSAAISVGVLTLSYTSDNSGSSGTMKYSLDRWSDASGGPAGPPSYTVTPTPTLGPITIFDNNASPVLLLNLPKTANPHTIIEYSIDRNTDSRTGRLVLTSNGTIVGFSDDNVETSSLGIVLSADISGANIRVLYTSTSTGFNGTFKYIIRSWN